MCSPMTQPLRALYGNTWLRLGVAVLGALVALACGATPTYLGTAPARDLRLSVSFTDAFAAGDGLVQMRVDIADPSKGGLVLLSGGQRLTCDGVSDPRESAGSWSFAAFSIPRQPPGGAYTCVYTDERGQHTTATIAMPPGRFAITSPVAGAHVPIAGGVDQPLVIHYDFPSPPGYVAPAPGQAAAPPAQGPYAIVGGGAGCGEIPPAPVQCPPQDGGQQPATGVYFLSDAQAAPGNRFEQTVSVPGYIYLWLRMRWLAPAGGFQRIEVDTEDQTPIVPITWTARAGGA